MSKTVLLTGGAGFIGSHLACGYLSRGYNLVIVDNLSTGSLENIELLLKSENVHFYNIDIRNQKELREIFDKHRPSIINHHAAQKSVPYSVEDPIFDLETNGIGLLNLLVFTKDYCVENFIYVSSGGALSKEIIDDERSREEDFPQLMSPYAITKFAGENYVKIYSELNNFKYTILRYSNVYGPRQVAAGECGVIPIFVNNILDKKPSTLFTYDDMPRGCTRDYVYVSDVVDINMLASEKSVNDVLNIGSGSEECILDIYKAVEEAFKTSMPIAIKGPRLGDVKRSVLDNSRAKKLLDWSPKVSLKEGLQLICDYERTSNE